MKPIRLPPGPASNREAFVRCIATRAAARAMQPFKGRKFDDNVVREIRDAVTRVLAEMDERISSANTGEPLEVAFDPRELNRLLGEDA
jgi:hypothetical protein